MNDMKTVLGRIGKDIRSYGGFAVVFLLYDIAVQFLFGAFCPCRIVTGLPCPGCGMTRSVICFAFGQFARGWQYNPLGICWLLLGLYFGAMRYLAGRPAKGTLQVGGILVVGMLLFYLYRMYRFFPGEVPMEYTGGNLLERAFPGYYTAMLQGLERLRSIVAAGLR